MRDPLRSGAAPAICEITDAATGRGAPGNRGTGSVPSLWRRFGGRIIDLLRAERSGLSLNDTLPGQTPCLRRQFGDGKVDRCAPVTVQRSHPGTLRGFDGSRLRRVPGIAFCDGPVGSSALRGAISSRRCARPDLSMCVTPCPLARVTSPLSKVNAQGTANFSLERLRKSPPNRSTCPVGTRSEIATHPSKAAGFPPKGGQVKDTAALANGVKRIAFTGEDSISRRVVSTPSNFPLGRSPADQGELGAGRTLSALV